MQHDIIHGAADTADARKIHLVCRAAQMILENGGETYRVEETALRMAAGFGIEDVGVVAYPTSLFVQAGERTLVRRITHRGVNTSRVARVNDVSRRVEHGEISLEDAAAALDAIAADRGWRPSMLTLAYAVSAAGFSLLFGGGPGVMLVTFLIGLIVEATQPLFRHMAMGALFGNFAGGLITAALAQLTAHFLPYGHVDAAIIGGIMPLLTGLLMTTAVRDTMYGDLVSGIARSVEALLLAGSVALGVYFGLSLITPVSAAGAALQAPIIEQLLIHCLGAFLGTLGYVFLLNAPISTMPIASLTAVFGYLVFLVLSWFSGVGEIFSYFLATVIISILCEIEARVMRMPSTIFLLSALVPLVPGYTFYCAMLSLVEDSGPAAAAYGMEAVQIVAAIAVGAAVTSVLFRMLAGIRNKRGMR